MNDTKRKCWNENHTRVGASDNFVTSTTFAGVNHYHDLTLPHNKTILEIGIGYGDTVRELKRLGNRVIACDISQVALDHVYDDVDKTCLTENIKEVEPVDLAISHLTLQHNQEDEVKRIINDVNLKTGAIFSFQFAALNPNKTVLSELIMNDINNSMLYFYSCEKMKSIINLTDKRIVREMGPYWHKEPFSFDWYIFRVQNKL